ncbi:MAG: GNAT family N-acetyltransferase [Thalassobius sp.]|nr:GNAT family N-acetyltransferase [Thalassovita sp.]
MEEIKFVHLEEIPEEQIIELMNNEKVGKLLPLLADGFTQAHCEAFLKSKKLLWEEHGYGPWAFIINGEFAGWGGLQPENGEADFALVLHPTYWGWGRKIFNKVKAWAFTELDIDSITVLFPPSRLNSKAIYRLGFKEDGELTIDNEVFIRFRLFK